MTNHEQFGIDYGKLIRQLLEDFEVVGNIKDIAIIPRCDSAHYLRDNVRAAITASSLRLSSIDYAKRQYCTPISSTKEVVENTVDIQYVCAYKRAKEYIDNLLSRMSTRGKPLPSPGVFGASLVLERLPYSFFCAHFLYKLGHRYEGHAVSRFILEQIAWANAARTLNSTDAIKKLVTTKTVSDLKKLVPQCGTLYGFLSKEAHLDYLGHPDFLRVENGKNVILHTQFHFYEYAQVILYLADLFGIVWELSQFKYLRYVESVEVKDGTCSIRKDRPFLRTCEECLKSIEAAYESMQARTDVSGPG